MHQRTGPPEAHEHAGRPAKPEDPEKQFNATTAIGYLLMLLNELVSEGAAERWMSDDARTSLQRASGDSERDAA